MGKYRKVDPRIWNDEKFGSLSNNGKLVFLFLLTHPHMTGLGAMRATCPGLAAELGWTEEAFREALREALVKGMVKAVLDQNFFWLPQFLKYNRPESPNVVRGWASAWDLIPECSLKTSLLQHVKDYLEGLPQGFRKAFTVGSSKVHSEVHVGPKPNQEQEQEQYLRSPSEGIRLVEKKQASKTKQLAEHALGRRFERWWECYPNKIKKKAARAVWLRLAPDDALTDTLIAAVAAHAQTSEWRRGFIPHPTSWLNGRRWEDEITPTLPGADLPGRSLTAAEITMQNVRKGAAKAAALDAEEGNT